MPLAIPTIRAAGGIERRLGPGDLLGGGESLAPGAIATVGAGIWTAAAIATGLIRRTGPVGGYTDTTDTATNIVTALAGGNTLVDAMNGQSFRLLFINTVAQAMTFAAGTGVVAGTGTLNCVASLWREYLFTLVNTSPPVTLVCNTTNASPTVTFVLPPGMTSFPMGPALNAVNITPGMGVNATAGITAGTTVLGITLGVGGIVGVTLSANATATQTISVNFTPTVMVDALRSGTVL